MPLLEGFKGILALIDTDLSLEDNRIESLRIEQASALPTSDTFCALCSQQSQVTQVAGCGCDVRTGIPKSISGNISEIVLERSNDVAQLVLGTFLAVEAKTAIPDVSNIDIGLTNGDEAAFFDRDHRGVAMNE